MAESHVISALVNKYSELNGLLEHHQQEVKRLTEEIEAIEVSIKVFAPDYNMGAIRPRKPYNGNEYFQPREAFRMILDALREAGKPMTVNEIAQVIANKKGYKAEEIDYKKFQAYLSTVLCRQKGKGTFDEVGRAGPRRSVLWGLDG